MIEKLKLTFALGQQVLGYYMVPVYWTKHIGKQDVQEVFKALYDKADESWFRKIKEIKKEGPFKTTQEHFIFKRIKDGEYTIEDRNKPPLTYLNNKQVGTHPKTLKDGDVIAIPLVKNNEDISCYIQVKLDRKKPKHSPLKQLVQCQNTKKFFIVYWEEDPDSRHHFSVKIEEVVGDPEKLKTKGYKNLRMAAETPCPYCGNKHLIFCQKCKTFVCYDGIANKVKCPGCKKKYRLSDRDGNIDIPTL